MPHPFALLRKGGQVGLNLQPEASTKTKRPHVCEAVRFSHPIKVIRVVGRAGPPLALPQLRLPHSFDCAQGRLFAVFKGWVIRQLGSRDSPMRFVSKGLQRLCAILSKEIHENPRRSCDGKSFGAFSPIEQIMRVRDDNRQPYQQPKADQHDRE